jgi:hypothetical protein
MAIVLNYSRDIATPREIRIAAAIARAHDVRNLPDATDFLGWRSEPAHGAWVKGLLEQIANVAAGIQSQRTGISSISCATPATEI